MRPASPPGLYGGRGRDRNLDPMNRRDEIKAAGDRVLQEIDPHEWLALIELEQEMD